MHLPPNVIKILDKLSKNGFEGYAVGGCVRDELLGISAKDWDITTNATPPQIKELFAKTVDTGIKHGTVTVLLENQHFEVTTYRIDGKYTDNRRPETVAFTADINEDLSRRDFTMNAIAFNPSDGFVDPFGGREDILRREIRCVGDAEARFNEDALRIMRAFRFAAQLGFNIDDEILTAAAKLGKNLANISVERIMNELTRLITAPHPHVLIQLETAGLLPYILPDFAGDLHKIIPKLKLCPPDAPMRYAVLLASYEEKTTAAFRRLKPDNKTLSLVSLYVSRYKTAIQPDRYEIKKILRRVPLETLAKLLTLQEIYGIKTDEVFAQAQDIINKNECYTLKNLAINGDDLSAHGIKKGTKMGEILERLLNEVMQNPSANTRENLLNLI